MVGYFYILPTWNWGKPRARPICNWKANFQSSRLYYHKQNVICISRVNQHSKISSFRRRQLNIISYRISCKYKILPSCSFNVTYSSASWRSDRVFYEILVYPKQNSSGLRAKLICSWVSQNLMKVSSTLIICLCQFCHTLS